MDTTRSGDRPDEEEPVTGTASSGGHDPLTAVTDRLAAFDGSPEARVALAEILAVTLQAFTMTSSVRDPLPSTAAGTAEESLAVLGGLEQLTSSVAAIDAIWQVRAERRIREDDEARSMRRPEQGKGAAHEIGHARRISPASSSFSLASARRLVNQMPDVHAALLSGRMPQRKASTLSRALSAADPDTIARIDELVGANPLALAGAGERKLRSEVQMLIQEFEPGRSRERAERAARSRHVTMTPLADGMAQVSAVLRGIDAAGMMKTLHRRAESLRAAGAKESVPALEADLLVDAALHSGAPEADAPEDSAPDGDAREGRAPYESAPKRPRTTPGLDVGIVISDTALLGRGDDTECARLEGYGALPAHIVTDTLRGTPPGYLAGSEEAYPEEPHPDEMVSAFYRRLYMRPSTGELVGMESRARAFPAGLARMIRWRDATCRTPWCNATIRQIDHVTPHHRGGPTSFDNGQGLCVRCNLLKELGLWVLTPLGPGDLDSAGPTTAGVGPGRDDTAQHDTAQRGTVWATTDENKSGTAGSSPSHGWAWTSPHGAQGISATPRLLGSALTGAARHGPDPQEPDPGSTVPGDEPQDPADPDGSPDPDDSGQTPGAPDPAVGSDGPGSSPEPPTGSPTASRPPTIPDEEGITSHDAAQEDPRPGRGRGRTRGLDRPRPRRARRRADRRELRRPRRGDIPGDVRLRPAGAESTRGAGSGAGGLGLPATGLSHRRGFARSPHGPRRGRSARGPLRSGADPPGGSARHGSDHSTTDRGRAPAA
ncbi:HNH endonuclease [Brachybacterium fresconis]|uniref:HNH nuclease domain-containing protein n=1 Tax=Brachybacterium fresconis TaxID=173363 RepID=A0ABS4YSJ1_9MICO|nr:HNH endonuclease signature motif containing protein [Brachybacterium fresconis]MBP2410923.1 hypothetical protein [Brachybacterium fresconis]